MDPLLFVVLNGPTCVLGLLINLFYIFCFLTPSNNVEKALRHPVKLLFVLIMVYSMLLQLTQLVMAALKFRMCSIFIIFGLNYTARVWSVSCMSSFAWLSFFYYNKIVPNQQPFFVWMRRNITTFIYCCLLCSKLYILLRCVIDGRISVFILTINDTLNTTWSVDGPWTGSFLAATWSCIFYLMMFALLMTGSWTATLVYLCRHMKRMEGSSFSLLHQRQMRVTITGLIQTILFLSCTAWLIRFHFKTLMNLVIDIGPFDFINTVVSFFVLIMIVNVGVSQSLFRGMASSILSKIKVALRMS